MPCILLRCKWPFGPFAFNKLTDWLIGYGAKKSVDGGDVRRGVETEAGAATVNASR